MWAPRWARRCTASGLRSLPSLHYVANQKSLLSTSSIPPGIGPLFKIFLLQRIYIFSLESRLFSTGCTFRTRAVAQLFVLILKKPCGEFNMKLERNIARHPLFQVTKVKWPFYLILGKLLFFLGLHAALALRFSELPRGPY